VAIQAGEMAPDFELSNHHGEKVKLSDFQGKKNVVLVFYPAAFTGRCTGELCALRDELSSFQNESVELLAISCDSMFTLKVFAEQEGYPFSLLADFWPHGEVAQKYGVFNPERGFAGRGTFIINKEGKVHWSVYNASGDARDLSDYKEALASL
jgi:peroxiredoxin